MSIKKRFLLWTVVSIASHRAGLIALAAYTAGVAGFIALAFLSSCEGSGAKATRAAEDAAYADQILQARREQYRWALQELAITTNSTRWQSAKKYWLSQGVAGRPWVWLPPDPDGQPPEFDR